jgi:hypothetical protein
MLAYFGIESSGLNLVVNLLILSVVVLYLSLIYWTYADARRRIVDPMLVGCATAASLFPFIGTIVYVILRPPEYLEDARERELEMQAAEARLYEFDHGLCPHCEYRVERDFVRCPSCLHKLKERCVSCGRPLDTAWTICPYCESEVPGATPSRRARRRRTAAMDGERSEVGGAVGGGDGADEGQPAMVGRGSQRERPHIGGGALPGVRSSEDEEGTRAPAAGAVDPVLAPRSGASGGRPDGRPRHTS